MGAPIFGCPSCSQTFQVLPEHAGKIVLCPNCSQPTQVPASLIDPAPPPDPLATTAEISDSPADTSISSSSSVYQCPHCQGAFQVPNAMLGEAMTCPHCAGTLRTIASPEPRSVVSRDPFPEIQTDAMLPNRSVAAPEISDQPSSTAPIVLTQSPAMQAALAMLPPKFDVPDPARTKIRSAESATVIIPDGTGGTRQISQRVLHIEHNGRQVTLLASTPAERKRMRLLTNFFSIVVGILILVLAYWLLI